MLVSSLMSAVEVRTSSQTGHLKYTQHNKLVVYRKTREYLDVACTASTGKYTTTNNPLLNYYHGGTAVYFS